VYIKCCTVANFEYIDASSVLMQTVLKNAINARLHEQWALSAAGSEPT
jgi:hypothetical protein